MGEVHELLANGQHLAVRMADHDRVASVLVPELDQLVPDLEDASPQPPVTGRDPGQLGFCLVELSLGGLVQLLPSPVVHGALVLQVFLIGLKHALKRLALGLELCDELEELLLRALVVRHPGGAWPPLGGLIINRDDHGPLPAFPCLAGRRVILDLKSLGGALLASLLVRHDNGWARATGGLKYGGFMPRSTSSLTR